MTGGAPSQEPRGGRSAAARSRDGASIACAVLRQRLGCVQRVRAKKTRLHIRNPSESAPYCMPIGYPPSR